MSSRGGNKQIEASREQKGTSDIRKEQNKNASKVYRQRRKQRLALLERLLEDKTQRPTPNGEMIATTYPAFSKPNAALQPASSNTTTRHDSPLTLHQSASSSTHEQEQADESLQSFFNNLMSISTPDVKQVIYVQQNGLFGAVMENTLALGLLNGAQMIFSQDGTSPFNKDWIESKGTMQLSDIKSKFAATPKDLRPLDIQVTFEHHVYLDVLPFPLFRDKALNALTCDPPLFDEDELCFDITQNAGLVVWGSQGNNQGMEACRPWDMRSWEPKPWFLRKYWYLCGGWEDEMWKAARWWHAMRNERLETRPSDLLTPI